MLLLFFGDCLGHLRGIFFLLLLGCITDHQVNKEGEGKGEGGEGRERGFNLKMKFFINLYPLLFPSLSLKERGSFLVGISLNLFPSSLPPTKLLLPFDPTPSFGTFSPPLLPLPLLLLPLFLLLLLLSPFLSLIE